jgi:TM2 domain-containing membrane protein YozV
MVEPHPVSALTQPPPYPPPEREGKASARRRASVKLATWLSAVPGLGQLYNRQPKKAAIFLLGVVGLFLVTLNIPGATAELLAFWKPRGSTMVVLSLFVEILSLLIFMSVFFLALTFWYDAMHDARRTAQERNGEREPGGRWWWFHR